MWQWKKRFLGRALTAAAHHRSCCCARVTTVAAAPGAARCNLRIVLHGYNLESLSYQSGLHVLYSGFRPQYLWLLASISTFLAIVPLLGQQPVEPWKAPHFSLPVRDLYAAASSVSAPEGTNVVLLEDDDIFTFDDAGRLTHTGYFVYKVLT